MLTVYHVISIFLRLIMLNVVVFSQTSPFHNRHFDFSKPEHSILLDDDDNVNQEQNDLTDDLALFSHRETYPSFDSGTYTNEELVWTISASKLKQMLNRKVYNRLQSPSHVTGITTTVEVAMYIESMTTFRAQTMDFELDMYLMIQWFDQRLKHNSSHPIILTDIALSQQMWQPDLYFVNSKFSYMHKVTSPNFMIVVYQDGFVLKTSRIDATLSCNLDLHNFPMDEQQCSISLQSYAFVHNVLNLTWHYGQGYPIQFNSLIKTNDMDRGETKYERCDSVYPLFRGSGKWSCLVAVIFMKRKLEFHVFQIFVPSAMLVVISWLSFWLDIRASAARISLTITTLLTLTTMSNSSRQELPHVPYMKANDIWFTICQAFVFSVLIEYTLVNFFLGRPLTFKEGQQILTASFSANSNIPLLNVTNGDRNSTPTPSSAKPLEESAKRVDTVAKIVFPISFTFFIICYWVYYFRV